MRPNIYPEGVRVHRKNQCGGTNCPFHNPSKHKMRTWPMNIRLDKGTLTERLCQHRIGHPDPDSLAYLNGLSLSRSLGVHGCDGCCDESK